MSQSKCQVWDQCVVPMDRRMKVFRSLRSCGSHAWSFMVEIAPKWVHVPHLKCLICMCLELAQGLPGALAKSYFD